VVELKIHVSQPIRQSACHSKFELRLQVAGEGTFESSQIPAEAGAPNEDPLACGDLWPAHSVCGKPDVAELEIHVSQPIRQSACHSKFELCLHAAGEGTFVSFQIPAEAGAPNEDPGLRGKVDVWVPCLAFHAVTCTRSVRTTSLSGWPEILERSLKPP